MNSNFWHFFGSKKEKTSLGFMQNFGTFKSFKNQRKKKDKEYMQLYDCTSYQIKPSFEGEKKITMKTIFTQSIKKSNIFTTFCSLSVQWRKENFPEFKPIFQKCSFVGKNQILLFFELQKFSCFFVQIYISDAWTLKSFFFFF